MNRNPWEELKLLIRENLGRSLILMGIKVLPLSKAGNNFLADFIKYQFEYMKDKELIYHD